MKRIITLFSMAAAMLLTINQLTAQAVPFWTENFTAGFPTGWTNDDASPGNAFWTWCANPELSDNDPGCPDIWNTPANQQKPFAAPTASTGFVTLDSDDYGELQNDHISQMTTGAIDCSSKSQVWLTFATHLGTYTYDADDKAIIKVSTDKQNWTTFQVFSGLTTSVRWSKNPEFPVIDISAAAASQTTVYIQWEWTGNYEYHWSVDDVELYDRDPTPPNDLAISEFFFPASSYATPAAHIADDVFGFSARLSNKGLEDQSGIKLKAWVENEAGAVLHADSISIASLAVGVEDSLYELPNTFTPQLAEGKYYIKYSVGNQSPDGRPNDNTATAEFVVTEGLFAKEKAPEQGYRPSNWNDTWYVANYYRLSGGNFDQFIAQSADFAFTTDTDELAAKDVTSAVYLMKANPDIDDELSNIDDADFFTSFEWVGLAEYEAPDTLGDNGYVMQNVVINDFNSGQPGVLLEPGGRYLLGMSYSPPSSNAFHAFNNDVNYYFTSTLIYTDEWSSFGTDANAVLRLNISLFVTTDDKPLADNVLRVFPNPATTETNLVFDFEKPTDATITIADLTGKVISIQDRNGLTNEQIRVSTATLASGTYLARVATADGTKTVKFAIAK